MFKVTLEWVFEMMSSKGYFVKDTNKYLNIVGIRTLKDVNKFNDSICYFMKDGPNWVFKQVEATTEPGITYMKSPINKKGVGILVEGQYIDTWAIDLHNGKYEALCQRLGKVKVYRDANKDNKLDLDVKTIESGFFGVNIHTTGKFTPEDVNEWSAACQVIKKRKDFLDLMEYAKIHRMFNGNKFSYTLVRESDFPVLKDNKAVTN